jgi:hypothetical protein
MKPKNFFEELKLYFENTPKEKIAEDWAETEKYNEIGPTVDEYFCETQKYQKSILEDFPKNEIIFSNQNLNPEFNSGFFYSNILTNAKSSILN